MRRVRAVAAVAPRETPTREIRRHHPQIRKQATMSRETPFPVWRRTQRLRAISMMVLGGIAATLALWIPSAWPTAPVFVPLYAELWRWALWVFGAALAWIWGWSMWLWSSYVFEDWWVERWAHAHGYLVE